MIYLVNKVAVLDPFATKINFTAGFLAKFIFLCRFFQFGLVTHVSY